MVAHGYKVVTPTVKPLAAHVIDASYAVLDLSISMMSAKQAKIYIS
ncbi:hypothetical protein M917_2620 [Psychrobacter aquaticus CMS 56]|uniref:Uncharacterized protein n=1 Tax=Psychrobacter aquaticus CMS 56 TaxID=1354303 RepID=U4T1B0_9GAMM|nr:hypothetical protein M917_2620 [Psychrobacter aquaticus CMS 56]